MKKRKKFNISLNLWFGRNNIIMNVSNNNKILYWVTSKRLHYTGRLKNSKFASMDIIHLAIKFLRKKFWRKKINVFFFGFLYNFRTILIILKKNRMKISRCTVKNQFPHNGCRLKKRKRKKKKLNENYRFRLKSVSFAYILDFLYKSFNFFFLSFNGFLSLPKTTKKFTILKSPFVNSKSRIIYLFSVKRFLINLSFYNSSDLRVFFIKWLTSINLKKFNVKVDIINIKKSYKF